MVLNENYKMKLDNKEDDEEDIKFSKFEEKEEEN